MSQRIGEDPDRLQFRPTKPTRLAVVIVAVAVTLVTASAVVSQSRTLSELFAGHPASQKPSTPPSPHPAPISEPVRVQFDPKTRTFLTDGLKGTLPAGWFIRQHGDFTIGSPGVGGCFGNACIPDEVGQHPLEDNVGWGAVFEVAQVWDPLTGKGISQTADNILDYWRQYTVYYTDVRGTVTVKHASRRTLTTNLPRPVRMITAELHYHEPGLPARFDHFYLLVVDGSRGHQFAYVAVWSDNATADVSRTIQDSINSLQVV